MAALATGLIAVAMLFASPTGGGVTLRAGENPAGPTGTAGPEAEADAATTFVSGTAAYEAGDFPRAIELFESLIGRGLGDGRLHYNLANAYLRSGDLGRAVAAFRRGQALLPRDRDLAANLAFARKSARDAIEPPRPSTVAETLFFWHFRLSLAELAWLTLVLNLFFWSALGARRFRPESEILRWSVFALVVPLLLIGGSLALRTLRPERVAVVLPVEIQARSAPTADSVVRFKLHAGSELDLIARRDGWLRVALPDGQQGWIEGRHAEIVEG